MIQIHVYFNGRMRETPAIKMHIFLVLIYVLIYAASFSCSAHLREYHHAINQNIQRFYQSLPLSHVKPTGTVGHAANTKNLPEDVFVAIAEYLDHYSLLSYSSACKLFRHAATKYIVKEIAIFNPFYVFPNDQLNRILHTVLFTNVFLKPLMIPLERLKMLMNSFTRYRNILPHLPAPIYNHLVLFLSAVSMRDLDSFDLLNHVQGTLDSILSDDLHSFHRIFLLRALIDHKQIVVDCFFNPDFLQNVSLERFNEILIKNLLPEQAQKLLKSLIPSFYNQQSDKSFTNIMKQLKASRLFRPSMENFVSMLTTTFLNSSRIHPPSLLFTLIGAIFTPETPAKTVLFWHAYTKYFTEYLEVFMNDNYTWWSFFVSVVFDVIRIYPQHIDEILNLTSSGSIEELELKFVSEMNLNKSDALELSTLQGHSTTVSFLLERFHFSNVELSAAILKSASTEFTDTLTLLLEVQPPEEHVLLNAIEIAVNLNNVDSFTLLLRHHPPNQVHLNRFFLNACRSHFLEIASILLNPAISPEIFKKALKSASITSDSEIFRFLINQTVHQYTQFDYDELLIDRAINDSDLDNLFDLLQYNHLYSHEGVLEALNAAFMHKNHLAIVCLLNYFVIPPHDADKFLLNCITFGNDSTVSFLFQVGLKFTKEGLITAHHSARQNGDDHSCVLIQTRMRLL